jgi:hypothetical protein
MSRTIPTNFSGFRVIGIFQRQATLNKNEIEARMMHGLITKEEAKFLIDHPSTNQGEKRLGRERVYPATAF